LDQEIVLQMRGISKSFPGVKALDEAQLELRRGEVHVLLGENGAGKSTLMKVLSGVYAKDEGEIVYEGKPVEIRSIQDAQKLGISIIHQELNMLAERSIAQNIYLGREPLKNPYTRRIDEKKMREDSRALLSRLGVDLSPDAMVKDLSIAQQQMVEVVKALSVETKVLIMDEPTSSLTKREIDALFAIVESLCAQGISVIYISHRMEEIFRIGDRVTVMRDGKYVGTVEVKDTTMDQLVTMMVGRQINQMYEHSDRQPGEIALETRELTGLRFRNVNIQVRCGEIVGIDADIARAIADELGMELEIEDIAFDSIIPELTSGKADFAMAGMTVDEKRKQSVDFSDTYAKASQKIIVKEDSDIASPDDLKGKIVGVQQGTTGDLYVSDMEEDKTVVDRYNKGFEAVQALIQGKVDAVVIDGEPAKVFVEQSEGLKVLDESFTDEEYAAAVKKGNTELLDKINGALKNLKESGKLDEIVAKYIKAE